MKQNIKHILGVAAILLATVITSPAQTNTIAVPELSPTISGGLQQIYDAALGSTNFAILTGGGRSTKGNHNLVFVDYLYNFNANAGVLLGFDDIAEGSAFTTKNVNFVKGGFNVQAQIAPLKNFGLTNFVVTPFASLLMDSGNGQVGQIVVAGANYRIGIAKGWYFNLGGFYENRTGGDTGTDGAYICGHIAFSRGF